MPVEPMRRKARRRGRHARPSGWRLRGWIATATAAVISIVLASFGSANGVPTPSDESLTATPRRRG